MLFVAVVQRGENPPRSFYNKYMQWQYKTLAPCGARVSTFCTPYIRREVKK